MVSFLPNLAFLVGFSFSRHHSLSLCMETMTGFIWAEKKNFLYFFGFVYHPLVGVFFCCCSSPSIWFRTDLTKIKLDNQVRLTNWQTTIQNALLYLCNHCWKEPAKNTLSTEQIPTEFRLVSSCWWHATDAHYHGKMQSNNVTKFQDASPLHTLIHFSETIERDNRRNDDTISTC